MPGPMRIPEPTHSSGPLAGTGTCGGRNREARDVPYRNPGRMPGAMVSIIPQTPSGASRLSIGWCAASRGVRLPSSGQGRSDNPSMTRKRILRAVILEEWLDARINYVSRLYRTRKTGLSPASELNHQSTTGGKRMYRPRKNHRNIKGNYLVETGAATCSTLDLMISTCAGGVEWSLRP